MSKEMKNSQLQQRIESYIDGVPLPKIDLERAKEEVRRRRRRKRAIVAAVSACACACIITLTAVLLPTLSPNGFIQGNFGGTTSVPDASDAPTASPPGAPSPEPPPQNVNKFDLDAGKKTATSYSALKEGYSGYVAPFSQYALSSNANAQFELMEYDQKEVLLCVQIEYVGGGKQFRATAYVDLTDKKYVPTQLSNYPSLGGIASSYCYTTAFENGEYVSRAYCILENGAACYIDLSANDEVALEAFMDTIQK